jgi:hypothetical protein
MDEQQRKILLTLAHAVQEALMDAHQAYEMAWRIHNALEHQTEDYPAKYKPPLPVSYTERQAAVSATLGELAALLEELDRRVAS